MNPLATVRGGLRETRGIEKTAADGGGGVSGRSIKEHDCRAWCPRQSRVGKSHRNARSRDGVPEIPRSESRQPSLGRRPGRERQGFLMDSILSSTDGIPLEKEAEKRKEPWNTARSLALRTRTIQIV